MNARVNLRLAVMLYEKQYIREALQMNDWNKIKTANDLGISLSSLYRKIGALKIKRKE